MLRPAGAAKTTDLESNNNRGRRSLLGADESNRIVERWLEPAVRNDVRLK